MPYYGSSSTRFARKTRRGGYGRKTYKKAVTAKDAYRIAKRVTRANQPRRESRFNFSKVMSTSAVANSFLTSDVTIISQGDTFNSRSGNQVYISGVKLNYCINNPHTAPRGLRLMVVKDINMNTDVLDITTWTNLFTGSSFGDQVATGTNQDSSFPLNTGVLKVMFDRTYYLAPNSEGFKMISQYIPIKQRVTYSDLGSTTTNVDSGSIYVIAHLLESTGTPSGTSSDSDGTLRVFFRDV